MKRATHPRLKAIVAATALGLAVNAHAQAPPPLTVTNSADTGAGSLRAALLTIAGDSACAGAPYVVNFSVGSGAVTFNPATPYPAINCTTTIDGYSQPGGASPNSITSLNGSNASILVTINGALATGALAGLSLSGANSIVRGLSVVNFATGSGILVNGSNGKVAGNFVGMLPNGTAAGNLIGIDFGFSGGEAGGLTAADRNVVGSNSQQGIKLGFNGFARNNLVGVAPDGSSPRGNGTFGISTNLEAGTVTGNRIAFNQKGIVAFSNFNANWSANEIYSNSLIGVDLCNDGLNPNDLLDGDSGTPNPCNGLQNSPVITGVTYSGGNTSISATLNTNASSGPYSIEIYGNDDNLGQGKFVTGCSVGGINTNASGNNSAPISLVCPGIVPNPTAITFGPSGSSEFSAQFLTPDMSPSTTSVSFGTVPVGGASAVIPVTIQNTGLGPLFVDSAIRSLTDYVDTTGGAPPNSAHWCGIGSDSAGAPLSGPSATSIAPAASCTLNLMFVPQNSGARNATLNIIDANSPNSNVAISLLGNGGVTPPTLNWTFNPVAVAQGTSPGPLLTLTITNPNGAPFTNTAFGATLPSGLVVDNPTGVVNPITPCGGGLGTSPGSSSWSINSLSVPTGGSCSFSMRVSAAVAPGVYSVSSPAGLINGNVLLAAVSSAASNTATLAVNAAALSLSPTSLGFGTVSIGQSVTLPVTLTNTGATQLDFSAPFTVTGANAGDFSLTDTCLPDPIASIATSGSCTVNVTFTPTAAGARSANISFVSNSVTSPDVLNLAGTGSAIQVPVVNLTPTSMLFAPQNVGTSSSPQVATLMNVGSAPLAISNIISSGDFAQTTTCGISVAPAASCTISVTFTPLISGLRTGNVQVFDNASGSPHTIFVDGDGVVPPVPTITAPGLVSFPTTQVGSASSPVSITIGNAGGGPLAITAIEIVGGGFAKGSDGCTGTSVPPSGSCTVSVVFLPIAAGANSATLRILSNAPTSPNFVGLSGTGSGTPVGTLSSAPASLTFMSQVIGTTSAAQPVVITNTGTEAVNVSAVNITGDFARTHDCSSVAGGSSCTVNVTFTPTVTGIRAGAFSIVSDASNSPFSVNLSGTGAPIPGPVIELSSSSLSFGNRVIGPASTPQALTLRNIGGAPLAIDRFTLVGDFVLSNGCPATVDAGGSCRIDVGFTPSIPGPRTGRLSVFSNATNGTQFVDLSGTGCRFTFLNRSNMLICQ